MNLYELYLDKLAARYQLPAEGKKIMWESGANIGKAGVFGQAPGRAGFNKALSTSKLPLVNKKEVVGQAREHASVMGPKAAGTIVDKSAVAKNAIMPKGKDRVALINRDIFGKKARNTEIDSYVKEVGDQYTDYGKQRLADKYTQQYRQARRKTIAHEAFHANAPEKYRNSEFLAHAYGGWKGTKGNVLQKAKNTVREVKHYGNTRPDLWGANVVRAASQPLKTLSMGMRGAAQTVKKSFTKVNPMKNWGAKPAGLTGAITKITKV